MNGDAVSCLLNFRLAHAQKIVKVDLDELLMV